MPGPPVQFEAECIQQDRLAQPRYGRLTAARRGRQCKEVIKNLMWLNLLNLFIDSETPKRSSPEGSSMASDTSGRASAGTSAQVADSAAKFDRIRRAHQSEVAEDYVEMISDLIAETGEARTVDLAARFGVTSPTVNAIVRRLQREELVETRPYRSIFLTDAGKALAEASRARHRIVRDFLVTIGVPDSIAEEDAEGVEHHVSEETLAVFAKITGQGRI